MKKSNIKRVSHVLFFALTFVLLFTLTVNLFFIGINKKIFKTARESLPVNLQFRKIFYLFPNLLVIKHASLADRSKEREVFFVTPTAIATFSVPDLLFRQDFHLENFVFKRGRGDYPRMGRFIKQYGGQIAATIAHLPRKDFDLHFQDFRLYLAPDGKTENRHSMISTHFRFRLRGREFEGGGLIKRETDCRLQFRGRLAPDGLEINNIVLKSHNLLYNGWAEMQKNTVSLHGYMFYDENPSGKTDADPTAAAPWKKFLQVPGQTAAPQDGILEPAVYVLDIDGRFTVFPERFSIERLDFSLNNAPMRVTGEVNLDQTFTTDLQIKYQPASTGPQRFDLLKTAELDLNGSLGKNMFRGNGQLDLHMASPKDSHNPLELIHIDLNPVTLNFGVGFRARLGLPGGKFIFVTNGNRHILTFDQLQAVTDFSIPKKKSVNITGALYGGSFIGQLSIDTSQIPYRVSASGNLDNLDAPQLKELLVHFSKTEGTLSSRFLFTSYPKTNLTGRIQLKEGKLKDFGFFIWLGETFSIPSVRDVPFHHVSTNFSVDFENTRLTDIDLTGDSLSIGGYYSTDRRGLVSSVLSLNFNRATLTESPKCRKILRLVDPEQKDFIFDFQLSGSLDAMNFQWMDTDLKKTITNWMPDFIERIIERRVDQSLGEGG